MLALPLVALLGQVAKVDIRAGGTLTSDAILTAQLKAAYAGAGLDVPTEHMTVMHAAMVGAYVIEVTGEGPSTADLDAYWCANDPALRNAFKDLAVINTGLTTIDAVHTCVGASGEPCASSTVCGGGSGGGGGGDDPAPAPAPEPEPEDHGDHDDHGDTKKENDNNGLSTAAIVFIVLGALFATGFLLFLLWPWIETCWKPEVAAQEPMITSVTPTPSGVALPTLFAAV